MDRQLLARATENSDAPTPGYMYLDIAKNAASNPSTCADIAKYLTTRLASKNNHNIKYKCLKVISKTCGSPYLRGQFKRCLSQDPNAMTAIKDALQFRGPPDPVRGDEPYERVRTAAKEALDAVYSDTPQDNSGGAPFATSVSASYGPSAHQQHAGGGAPAPGGARRMEGIGNPMFSDPRLEPQPKGIANMTAKDVLSEAKETVMGIIKDPLARNVTVQVGGAHQHNIPRPGGSYGGPGAYSNPPPGRNELMHETGGQWTMASNRGPSAVAPPPNYNNDAAYYKSQNTGNAYAWAQKGAGGAGGVGGSWASASPSVAAQAREPYQHQATPSISVNGGGGGVSVAGGGGTAVSDGSYEKQLVMELCPPGGMKAEPPPDKLNQFTRSVANLNPDLVCPVLLDCLEEGQPWIIRAKALCVIEACMKHGQKPGNASNAYTDFFHACSFEIAPLANHSRVQIRDPAKRVLSLLGVAAPAPGQASAPVAAPPAGAPPAPVQNLLDFDMGPTTPPSQAPSASGVDSLFGGLNVAGSAQAVPPTAPPTAPPPPPTSGNLLGDWDSAASTDVTVPAPAPSNDSLFGDMMVKESPAPSTAKAAAPEVTSIFDNMSLKAEEASTPVDSASAAPGGSAFGFINQSGSMDSVSEKKTDTIPSLQSRDSFDPLKNMTPNTAQKMMQVSPEQMQAMMYQQMMMQQQMQISQMMAMQQQQARRGNSGMYMPQMQGVMRNNAAAKTSFAFMDTPVKDRKSVV